MKKYLVFDIGGTHTKYALMNEDASFIENSYIETSREKLEDLIESMGEIFDKYKSDIEGIAVSIPGVVDSDTGYMYFGGSLLYNNDINFVEVLKKRCPVEITLENDAKAAALAELWKGNLKGVKHGAVITLGTGVGGGVIINGQLHKGFGYYAGEFSHVRTNLLEPSNVMSSWGALSSSVLLSKKGAHAKNQDNMDGHEFFELANNGDETILAILDNYTKNLVTQILNLQAVFSPERIAIGGGISAQQILMEYIKKNLELKYKIISQSDFKVFIPKVEIVPCKFGNDSNLVGALYHHLKLFEKI